MFAARIPIQIWLLFTTLLVSRVQGEEFLYPVAATGYGDEQKVYILYQKSLTHIELWLWDPLTKAATKALLSTFTPAGVKILPHDVGFSFIDNGRIKVKMHSKRSPKSLEWYEPVYDIGNLGWIDASCYYFHAKQQEHYGIFHGTLHGEIDPLVVKKGKDCMYPNKIDSTLFYIERTPDSQGGSYALMRAPYPATTCDPISPFNNTQDFERRVSELLSNNFQQKEALIGNSEHEKIIDFGTQPVAFLYMLSDHEGFCIGHPTHLDKHDATMPLVCYYLQRMTYAGSACVPVEEKRSIVWRLQELFTFQIPLDLLLPESSSRLYESILPLLPYYDQARIYFVDSTDRAQPGNNHNNSTLALYCYHRTQQTITRISRIPQTQQSYFAPLRIGNRLLFGGSTLHEESRIPDIPGMWLNEQGLLCIELPYREI